MALKPFTDYICSVGGVGSGHSGHYTGAYRDPNPRDDFCMCGAPLAEEVSDGYNYKVVFETINSFAAADMVARYGKGIWVRLSPLEWEALPWTQPITSEGKGFAALKSQYKNLKRNAETHEQPIRNVQFLKSKTSEWVSAG